MFSTMKLCFPIRLRGGVERFALLIADAALSALMLSITFPPVSMSIPSPKATLAFRSLFSELRRCIVHHRSDDHRP